MEIEQTEFIEQLKKFKESISNLGDKKKYVVIKEILDYLKENNIYDYKDSNIHLDIYRYFYNNEIALRYLKDKDPESVKNLGERLDPMETTLTNEDINLFQNCTIFIQELKISVLSDKEIFDEIKKRIEKDNSILHNFKSYSNNYISIKEYDENFDEKNSIFKTIEENINSGIYYFKKNNDEYKKNNKDEEEIKGFEYLYDLKCKINVKSSDNDDEKLKEKNKKIIYFEKIVDKITTIKFYVDNLRDKGSPIQLFIQVHFCYDHDKSDLSSEIGKFLLEDEEKTFKNLEKYLINITKYYNSLLKQFYLENEYIRFTYGKQFNFIIDYLTANNNDNSFANYFLNTEPKKELDRGFPLETYDGINHYKIYYKNSLKNISNYIQKYFEDNYINLENFYKNFQIKNSKKGINYFNSSEGSIEETTIDLFIEFTGKYPISQNILLINKNTSLEEIEFFLYRALLCKYNTLFIIGINDILKSQEEKIMEITNFLINYIKKRDNPNSKIKRGIKPDIKSCTIFIYNKYQKQNKFIEQIKKIASKLNFHKDLKRKQKNKINNIEFNNRNSYSNIFEGSVSNFISSKEAIDRKKYETKIENITIYLSNVNGTGKTFAIKEDIKEKGLEYKYFPFGGFLTKKLVYNRIKDLLEEIKKEGINKNKICIHLDLYETEQQGIMNDFLFSFLFTQYYKNDENVIYIPREFSIFVEIPNCFVNFIETYPILKIFIENQKEEINLESQRKLKLLNEKEKNLFNSLDIANVEEFINKKIQIKNPSYYQKRQFINAFLSQINSDNIPKINEDILEKIINATRHFTENKYSSLLKEANIIDKKIEINDDEQSSIKTGKDSQLFDEKTISENITDSKKIKENNNMTEMSIDEKILEKLSSIDKDNDNKEKKENEKDIIPLIFYNKKDREFFEVSMMEKYYDNYDRKQFLCLLKKIFNLDNPIEEKDPNNPELKSLDEILGEYVITIDNFRKMVKIYFMYISNINLIIMGETGCGKTLLISKIYELLNNGEKLKENDNKINIHGGITDEDIIKRIEEINDKANKVSSICKNKIWVFIDEINACKSMGLFNEIICNHSCKGKKLNENLVFIAACNPYRKSKSELKLNNALIPNNKKQNNILYNVNPLSHSLMNFVYYFGSLSEDDEEKYIKEIIKGIYDNNEEDLKEISTKMLLAGHKFVREYGDVSSVSLREINRFKRCYYFFIKYYEAKKCALKEENKEEEINRLNLNDNIIVKKKSIILSLYTCYYMKISNLELRKTFDAKIKEIETSKNIMKLFELQEIIDLKRTEKDFSNILEIEEKYILSQIDLGNGIAENRPLRDNVFLLFVSINLNIPIFIIGKPGCSKTLSVNLIDRALYGKYSKTKFFSKYPAIFKTWFQGSENTSPEEVENLFKIAERRVKTIKNLDFYGQHPISLIFFDEIGLCEISDKKPLKILNFKFETENYNNNDNDKSNKYISFIGISNWILDAAKMNRGFTLSVPELHENIDDMNETCEQIVKSINPYLWKEQEKYKQVFESLYKSYYDYKKALYETYKLDESKNPLCHGSRDFYFLIKNVAYSFDDLLKQKIEYSIENEIKIITNAIERNFDALNIGNIKSYKLFKTFYIKNRFENEEHKEKEFDNFEDNEKDVIKNIISNIKDKNSRNLLLITKSSLNILLVETLLKNLNQSNENKIKPIFKIGSPFENDKGEEYKLKIINIIQQHAKNGDILILQKFSNILSSLYELFNLNYLKKDGKNYARISVGKSREQFIEVNKNFKVILLYDKEEIKDIVQPIASRFEKIDVDFSNLLNKNEMNEAENVEKIINRLTEIKLSEQKELNYDLNNLIVNLDLEEIQSMIYYCKNNKIDYKKYIFEKITPCLPQDIIGCLIFEGLLDNNNDLKNIKNIYENNIEKFNNIQEFLKVFQNSGNKYAIIYTFSSLSVQFDENFIKVKNESLIKSESYFEKIILHKFYKNKNFKILILKIHINSIKDIIYLKTFIDSYEEFLKNNSDYDDNDENENKKIIFTVHILRKFYANKEQKKERKKNIINTLSYTSKNVQHLFIDNLKGDGITLKDINGENVNNFITKIIGSNEFCKIALDYFNLKIKNNISETKGINSLNFNEKMEKYLEGNEEIIERINKIIINRIKVGNVLKKMYEDNYVKADHIDIVSTLSKYMINIYKKYTLDILEVIENNYFLTTLMVINSDDESSNNDKISEFSGNEDELETKNNQEENINPDKEYIENEIVENIKTNYLQLIENSPELPYNQYNNNLCLLFKIPGLFILYQEISQFILENVKSEYYQNEKDFRFALPKKDEDKKNPLKFFNEKKKNFHENEEKYLNKIYNYLSTNDLFKILLNEQTSNDKEKFKQFIELLLKDYITFYLFRQNNDKNIDFNSKKSNLYPNDVEHQLIEKLIEIRFEEHKNENENEEDEILKNNYTIQKNENDDLKVLLIKILWIESNYDYITNIIKIYWILSSLFQNIEKNNLFKEINEYIRKNDIRYITQEKRNPEHTKEVNECFYIILASICQCITNENILNRLVSDEIYNYIECCEKALAIITRISDELLLFLNERYIIEEFLLIIDVANKGEIKDIDFSKNILSRLKNLSNIIQSESDNKIEELISAFIDTNKFIINELDENNGNDNSDINEEIDKNDDEYYELLSNFYLKELRRLTDINYKSTVLEQILNNDKIIEKSLESFKVLFKSILQPEIDKFKDVLSSFTSKTDDILQMMDRKQSIVLDDSLLYLFEKNSFIYFEKASSIQDKEIKKNKFKTYYEKNNPDYIIFDEPLRIFKECINYLENIFEKPESNTRTKNKKLKKLFCLAFIRVYIYKYIHILNEHGNTKIDDSDIIKTINGNEETKVRFMIKLYTYKIIYNICGRNISKMQSNEILQKFNLSNYKNYRTFINQNNTEILLENYLLPKEDLNFEDEFLKVKSGEKNKFNSIDTNKIKKDIKEYGEDIYYMIFSNLLCSNIEETINYNESEILNNFWKNIFDKVFSKEIKNLLKMLFNVEDLKKLNKNENIQRNQIEMLLYSMRFCLKSLNSSNNECVYKKLLLGDQECLKYSYFIGNDISENNYYNIYVKLIEFFKKNNKKDGVYVCLCRKGFYQYIPPNGYPTDKNYNEKCEFCHNPIGSNKRSEGYLFWKKDIYYPIKREGYLRIFKNEAQIKNESNDNLNQINYMTLDQFFKNKINPIILNEKPGIIEISSDHFKKTNKMIRYLKNQISFRLLHFILYSHLFFAKLMNNKMKINVPSSMSIIQVLEEDWNQLKNLLNNRNISIFINLIFKDVSDELIKCNEIEEIKDLFEIEEKLEKIILDKLQEYNDYESKYKQLNEKLRNIKLDSTASLLNENFDFSLYKNEIYPFYKYFLYTEFIHEENIKHLIRSMNNEDNIMLLKYIHKKDYEQKVKHLETLGLFNEFNNLLFDTYSDKITREEAESRKLNEENVYEKNKPICTSYFKNIKNFSDNLVLKEDDVIKKFLIDKNSDESEKIIDIYQKYISEQNYMIKDILVKKHNDIGFPIAEEINVQSIQNNEIFSFKLKNTCLTEIIFENSIRNKNFRDITIYYDKIEDKLTKKLLKKVKLLNNNLKYIVYKNEEYLHENTSIFNDFVNNYEPLEELTKAEKREIKKFFDKIEYKEQCLNIIEDFSNIILDINNKYKNIPKINQEIENENEKEIEENKDDEEKEIKKDENENIKKKEIKLILIDENNINNENHSNEFKNLLKIIGKFTFDKLYDIFIFSEKLMFLIIKNELLEYCSSKEGLTSQNKEDLNNFYKDEKILTKEVLSSAIRRYLTRYLIKEKDKEKNIKNNERNFIKYLYIEDLWDNEINKNEQKENEIKKIENMNISINQILDIYEEIGGDNFINEELNEIAVKEEIPTQIINDAQDNNIEENEDNTNNLDVEVEKEKEKDNKPEEEEEQEESENEYKNDDDDYERD